MSNLKPICCIDIGTTNIKYKLYASETKVSQYTDPVDTLRDAQSYNYQDPSKILTTILNRLKYLASKGHSIEEIAISVPMHTLIYNKQLLLWSDQRADSWVKSFKQVPKSEHFYRLTGTPIHPMSPFAKIAYLKSQGLLEPKCQLMGLKEFLMQALTGNPWIDLSTASTTGLLDIHQLSWNREILSFLGICEDQLGHLVESHASFPLINSIQEEIGLKEPVTVYAGGCDGCLASWANYSHSHFRNVITIGTSAAVRRLVSKPYLSEDGQSFCYYLDKNQWVIGGPSNNGGNVLQWWSQIIYNHPDELFNHLDYIIDNHNKSAREIQVSPHLFGERAPLWDSNTSLSIQGLKYYHKQEDISYALIIGLFDNIKRIADQIGIQGPIAVNGKVLAHPKLREVLATVLNHDIHYVPDCEPADGLFKLIQTYK